MTEHCVGTGRQDRRHPPTLLRERPVPHGIDTQVNDLQPPAVDAVANRPSPEPKLSQLPPSNHPVLAAGKLGDRSVERRSSL
jgi:hypothetical protein